MEKTTIMALIVASIVFVDRWAKDIWAKDGVGRIVLRRAVWRGAERQRSGG